MLSRLKRKAKRQGDLYGLYALADRVWTRAKTQAIERAMGISA